MTEASEFSRPVKSGKLVSTIATGLVGAVLLVAGFFINEVQLMVFGIGLGSIMIVIALGLGLDLFKVRKIVLKGSKILVYYRRKPSREYSLPGDVKSMGFFRGEQSDSLTLVLQNSLGEFRLVNEQYKQMDALNRLLEQNIPMIRRYDDGRVEDACLFDGVAGDGCEKLIKMAE